MERTPLLVAEDGMEANALEYAADRARTAAEIFMVVDD